MLKFADWGVEKSSGTPLRFGYNKAETEAVENFSNKLLSSGANLKVRLLSCMIVFLFLQPKHQL